MSATATPATLSSLRSVHASASGAATVTVTKRRGIQVALNPARVRGMDESALAEEIEDCAAAALARFRRESQRIVAGRQVTLPPGLRADLDSWRAELVAELEAVEVVATSDGGLVEAILNGEADLAITIRHNAVRRTDVPVPALERELNEAIERAGAEYASAAMSIRRVHGERLRTG